MCASERCALGLLASGKVSSIGYTAQKNICSVQKNDLGVPMSAGLDSAAFISPRSDEQLANIFSQRAVGFTRGRAVDLTFLVQFGQVGLVVHVRQGEVVAVDSIASLPPLASFDFSVKAPADAWSRFWQAMPEAGSHDIFALTRFGHMSIQGNLHPLMSNLQFVKDLLAVGRGEV